VRTGTRRLRQGNHRRPGRPGPGAGHTLRAIAQARCELAGQFPGDLRNLDAELRETKKKLAAAVRASRATLTEIFGAGPVIAGTITGGTGGISRSASRDHFAACNGTAPIEVSSGGRITCRLSLRGNRRVNHAIHMAAITQISHRHSGGRAYYDPKIVEGKTIKRHSGASNGGSAMPSTPACGPAPAGPPQPARRAREGNRGTTLSPARLDHTPGASSSDKPLPGP
jgi:transposase